MSTVTVPRLVPAQVIGQTQRREGRRHIWWELSLEDVGRLTIWRAVEGGFRWYFERHPDPNPHYDHRGMSGHAGTLTGAEWGAFDAISRMLNVEASSRTGRGAR